MRNAIVIICSRGVLQPSAIRHQEVWEWSEPAVSDNLSPLRPVLGNGDLLIKILRNALTFMRVLRNRNAIGSVLLRMLSLLR